MKWSSLHSELDNYLNFLYRIIFRRQKTITNVKINKFLSISGTFSLHWKLILTRKCSNLHSELDNYLKFSLKNYLQKAKTMNNVKINKLFSISCTVLQQWKIIFLTKKRFNLHAELDNYLNFSLQNYLQKAKTMNNVKINKLLSISCTIS